MSEGFESSDLEHAPNPTENDNVTLEDVLAAIAENTTDITQLQKDYADLLKKIINIQSGIASIANVISGWKKKSSDRMPEPSGSRKSDDGEKGSLTPLHSPPSHAFR